MNKKFSTLMLGLLLTSAFASADNVVPANVQKVAEWKSGKSYFVVADGNEDGEFTNGEYFLSVAKSNDTYSFSGVAGNVDVKNLTWTFTEVLVGKTYHYALKNNEYGIYLTFDANGAVKATEKVEEAYFTAENWNNATAKFEQGDKLYSIEKADGNNGLRFTTPISLGNSGEASHILLCEYKENILTPTTAVNELNDVKGGAGFNLKFSADNTTVP